MIKIDFSFDDGSIYDLRTADMLNQYGFTAIFYIPVNWQRHLLTKRIDPLSIEDVRFLDRHFTIGSHGVNHELLTRVSGDIQDREIFDSKKWWNEVGVKVDSFCYPRGYYDDDIKAKVKKAGYKTARTVKIGNLKKPKDDFEIETTIHMGYDRDEYETDWYSFGKLMIDRALLLHEQGEDVYFNCWGHSEEIHRYQQWDNFGRFVALIKERLQ